MVEQKEINRMNEVVQWDAFIDLKQKEIKSLQLQIKDDTEPEREEIAGKRKEIKVAQWKKNQLYEKIRAEAKDGYSTVITLDDFTPREIDVNLAASEYQKAMKAERESNK